MLLNHAMCAKKSFFFTIIVSSVQINCSPFWKHISEFATHVINHLPQIVILINCDQQGRT